MGSPCDFQRYNSLSLITSWITGLMAENYDAVGFIPKTTVETRYIRRGWYVLQTDERGRKVGYLLHGRIQQGNPVVVSQHCIQYEKRLKGYGEKAFQVLKERAERGGASSIKLRCADDLPALLFWQSVGFEIINVTPGGQKRKRMIMSMTYPLSLPLLEL
jgi:GNAT superfamily N-acetyltransferase